MGSTWTAGWESVKLHVNYMSITRVGGSLKVLGFSFTASTSNLYYLGGIFSLLKLHFHLPSCNLKQEKSQSWALVPSLIVLKTSIKNFPVFTLELFCPYLPEWGVEGDVCLFYWHLSLQSRKVSVAYMINIDNDNKGSYNGFPLILYYSGSGA